MTSPEPTPLPGSQPLPAPEAPRYEAPAQAPHVGSTAAGDNKKKSSAGKKGLIGCLGCAGLALILAIVVGGCSVIMGGGADQSTESASTQAADPATQDAAEEATAEATSEATQEAAPAAPGIGETVSDEKVAFTVTAFGDPVSTYGESPFEETAQGEFRVADVVIKNLDSTKLSLTYSDVVAKDAAGSEYEPTTVFVEQEVLSYEEVNPGNQVAKKVVFDVPAGTQLVTVEYAPTFSFSDPLVVAVG